jgi:hypothetical protein
MREAHGLKAAGRLDEAIGRYGEAVASGAGQEGLLMLARCELAVGRAAEAVGLAERARAMAPQELDPQILLAEALLAMGYAQRAADAAGDIRRRWSTSQHAIALQATAWRMLGDRRYRELHDYKSLVWSSLVDVAAKSALIKAHVTDVLPLAVDGSIRRMLTALGTGDDPVRGRNRGTYALHAIARVDNSTGDQVRDHGWLSGLCCISAAEAVPIRFGRPGVKTQPELEADHIIDLTPGTLVLFPSYMWQGFARITNDASLLLLTFDLAPGAVDLPQHD